MLPVDRLAKLCRARGVRVLIDGAHGAGMLDVDVGQWGSGILNPNWGIFLISATHLPLRMCTWAPGNGRRVNEIKLTACGTPLILSCNRVS